ncbi:Protein LAZ1 homolog 2 [Linum grandiflorum]
MKEANDLVEAVAGNTYRNLHRPALITGGCFAVLAVFVSLLLILQHLRSYTNPSEQKWIVAVLFMVPVYATESLLSLWNHKLSLACDILRNCYEAFALYSFGSYLVACLGGEGRVLQILESDSKRQLVKPLMQEQEQDEEKQDHHVAALGRRPSMLNFFFHPCVIGSDLFDIERFGLVQYMILKTLCAFLAFLLEIFGVYGDGTFKWYYGYGLVGQMAIAAITHAYVFPAEPYHYIRPTTVKSISTKEKLKKTRVEAPGTSVTESVQDIVVHGGQHVVKDVVLTINQAMGPVEKGVTKIHQTFHRRSTSSGVEEGEAEILLENNHHS